MSADWVILLSEDAAEALGALRRSAELEILRDSAGIWLRGSLDEGDSAIRSLPALARYHSNNDNKLVPFGAALPVRLLPSGEWKALTAALRPVAPELSSCKPADVSIVPSLERDGTSRRPNGIICRFHHWLAWVDRAPAVRLNVMRFALCDDGRVFIHGTPLPPINGKFIVVEDGIAVPAGMCVPDYIPPSALRSKLKLAPGDIALLNSDQNWEFIKADWFQAATRAAVRLSAVRENGA